MGVILKKLFWGNYKGFLEFLWCNAFINDGILIFLAYYENCNNIQGVLKTIKQCIFSKTIENNRKLWKLNKFDNFEWIFAKICQKHHFMNMCIYLYRIYM